MQLKTVSSIGLAFLLVVGVVGVASAQEVAATQGVVIRVEKPEKSNTWVKIGENIVIQVLSYDQRLDAGFTVTVMDSAHADDAATPVAANIHYTVTIPNTATQVDVDDPNTAADEREVAAASRDPAGALTVTKGLGSGIDTFTVTITVEDDDQAETDNDHAVKVVVDTDTNTNPGGAVNNLMTDKKITPATAGFGSTIVGRGEKFGIDSVRPDAAGVFTSIVLDAEDLAVDTVANTTPRQISAVRMKVGDDINLSLELSTSAILTARPKSIQVGFVEGTPGQPDSAFSTAPIMFTLGGDKLYNPTNKISGTVAEGSFADLQAVRLEAYLEDVAGNLSSPAFNALAGGAISGSAFSPSGYTIHIDGTSPKITMTYPHPDSAKESRITADIVQDIETRSNNSYSFEAGNKVPDVRPLNISLSEKVDSIVVSHGDSMRTFLTSTVDAQGNPITDPTQYIDPTGNDSTAKLELDFGYTAAGGTPGDLKVMVWDLYGNMTELVNDAIVHDGVQPSITNLFPTGSGLVDGEGDDIDPTAPKNADNDDAPTINLSTKDPAFQINEELDSLAIRYTETGGSRAIRQGYGPGNTRLETTASLITWPVDDTSFVERQRYDLQILAIDLAGNISATKGGTLTFTKGFGNPDADKFMIVADPDEKQVAGEDIVLTLTVLDSTLTREEGTDVKAVTYPRGDEVVNEQSAIAVVVSGDQAAALAGVSFSGTGVTNTDTPFPLPAELIAGGMVAKGATLDRDGWHAGERTVKVKSTTPLTGAMIMAAEGKLDPATASYAVRISGSAAKAINVQVAEFSQFTVTAREGQITGSNVAGAFTINVKPVDEFGNRSMQIDNTVDSKAYESVDVTFSTSNAAVTVPSGQQKVPAGGADFGAVAANISGSATINVRTVDETLVTGTGDDAKTGALTGSVSVTIVTDDGDGPDPGAPAAPANILVQDWRGGDGQGDQGGMVKISFPNSSQHEAVTAYQIFREVESTSRLDDEGNVEEIPEGEEPVKTWMAWTSVSFAGDAGDELGNAGADMQEAVVPTLDNVATNWGVTAVSDAGESDRTTATGKRVYTKESVQQVLELLGMPEAELLTDEELMNQFNAPEDYVKSVIGDQKNVVFAPVNPDLSALIGSAALPSNIRTGHAGNLLSSARTVTEEPVGAVDDIAPAAITDASGDGAGGVVLRWTASADDRTVGSWTYRGFNIPIPGVKGYAVMRGASEEDLEKVASIPSGSTQFTDDDLPDGVSSLVYRIDAYDDDNVTMSDPITVANISVRLSFVDANGDPVYLMVLPSQGGNLEVDLEDFLAFAAAYNSQKGDANYNPQADVDDDGTVAFSDFLTAAASFGRTAVVPAGSKLAVVPQRPGVNADTEMTLELGSDKVLVGETISLTVSMANARQLNGFGLELVYDADKFEFVSAAPAENDLLKSGGGETPLFKNWPEEGRVSVVNAIIESGSVSGEGALVTFTFKVLREFEDDARFEIAQGVVIDPNKLQNPVVTLGALDVQSTPTEFALHQNYPNPFNPQTNIPYDLAEGGDVVLRIYNLLGQEVRTLVRERQAPGRYMVQWSGMDDRGVSVSSGIYFYQVSVAGKFQDAKRLMLLK